MVSSLYVGYLLQTGQPGSAFGIAAAVGAVGFFWTGGLAMVPRMISPKKPASSI
jgi:hypothetical protein